MTTKQNFPFLRKHTISNQSQNNEMHFLFSSQYRINPHAYVLSHLPFFVMFVICVKTQFTRMCIRIIVRMKLVLLNERMNRTIYTTKASQ